MGERHNNHPYIRTSLSTQEMT